MPWIIISFYEKYLSWAFPKRVLFGKNLGWILKRLKFQRISARIQEKHRRLFSNFTLKANVWFDHKLYPVGFQFVRKFVPFFQPRIAPK
jgi:hypothetical protein